MNATKSGKPAFFSTISQIGIEFIDENGGGPGVRLKKRQQMKAQRAE